MTTWTYWVSSGAAAVAMAIIGGAIGKAIHRSKGGKNGAS